MVLLTTTFRSIYPGHLSLLVVVHISLFFIGLLCLANVVRIFRGRHASKMTEEEEDEEYLKEEEDALDGAGGTRLVSQPSCEHLLDDSVKPFVLQASLKCSLCNENVYFAWKVRFVWWRNSIERFAISLRICDYLCWINQHFVIFFSVRMVFKTKAVVRECSKLCCFISRPVMERKPWFWFLNYSCSYWQERR